MQRVNGSRLVDLLLVLFMLTACSNHRNSQEKPNVIFILTDDLGAWACGFNNPDFLTPQIDALAKDGIVFTEYFNTTAICMASRATIMTGMYEYKTGTNFMHGDMDKVLFDKSYPVLLRESGYFTGFVGKFGFLTPPNNADALPKGYNKLPVDRFDWWAGGVGQTSYTTSDNYYLKKYAEMYPHSSAANGAAAVEFIQMAKGTGKPFCLSVSFKSPHLPDTPDPQYDGLFKNRTYALPKNYWRENGTHLPLQAKLGRQFLSPEFYGFYPENFQKRMASYNQLIYGVDVAIGMIRDALKVHGLDKNTILVFTSDNGYFNGNHGLSCKVLPYEEGAHSPLIIVDPRVPDLAGKTNNALCGNIDIAPTILSWAGLESPATMDGKSLVSAIENPGKSFRKSLTLMNVWGPAPVHFMAVVSNDYKYIYWPFAEGMAAAEELYDRKKDPLEMFNLVQVGSHQDKLVHYRDSYDHRLRMWGTDQLSENGYKPFITIFDRNEDWQYKKALIPQEFMDAVIPFQSTCQEDPEAFFERFGIRYPDFD